MVKIKIKAKADCKFGYEGTMYRFAEGEEQDVDVPKEKIDTNNFEILGESREEKKIKKTVKTKEHEGGVM